MVRQSYEKGSIQARRKHRHESASHGCVLSRRDGVARAKDDGSGKCRVRVRQQEPVDRPCAGMKPTRDLAGAIRDGHGHCGEALGKARRRAAGGDRAASGRDERMLDQESVGHHSSQITERMKPNQCAPANRRDASPPGAGWPFGRAFRAPPRFSAAVAALGRSICPASLP